MIRFVMFMILFASLAAFGLYTIDRAHSGTELGAKLRGFHHWTVQAHWVNPVSRTITVLLDEEAATGTDTACESVLGMLDQLTTLAPGWRVHLESPTGFVPTRWNPIGRDGVQWMLQN